MRLPYDYTRCSGVYCIERDTCARYKDQPSGVLLSFTDFSSPDTDAPCASFIQE